MTDANPPPPVPPEGVLLKARFDALRAGDRAALRRVAQLADIPHLPAYYRWLNGRDPHPGLARVALLLPHAGHRANAASLGQQLRQRAIHQDRVVRMVRAHAAEDLHALRRLLIHAELRLDWGTFAPVLLFWGEAAKRRILQDFFTTPPRRAAA